MSNEDSKTGGGDPLLPPPPPSSASLRPRGGGKDSPIYVQDSVPAEDVRRSKSSGCWLCGCDADHDVIPPSSSTTNKASPAITTNNPNRVTDLAPDLFPAGAGAVVDYLRTNGFPTGLCKTLVNLEVLESIPWRIVIVDCSTQTEIAFVNSSSSPSSSSMTHWQDVGGTLSFIAGLARSAHAITDFRLGSEVMPINHTANPMVFAKTAALPTPLVVGDPSEQDGSASLYARLGLGPHDADTLGLDPSQTSGSNSHSNGSSSIGSISHRPGRTALCRDLMDVVAEVTENEHALGPGLASSSSSSSSFPSPSSSSSNSGNRCSKSIRASVIIVTDSTPADGDVLPALKALELLPVNVVVRLCTDDNAVAVFWRALRDKVPRVLMEVLHGPVTEAAYMQGLGTGVRPGLRQESASRQGLGPGSGHWLTYAMPLHRLREFGLVGVHVGVLDCLIDQDLAPATMHRLIAFLFGLRAAQLPLPAGDWSGFVFVTNLLNQKDDLPPSSSCLHHQTAHYQTQGQGLALRWLDIQALTLAYGPTPDPNTFGNRARSKSSTATAMTAPGDNHQNNQCSVQ